MENGLLMLKGLYGTLTKRSRICCINIFLHLRIYTMAVILHPSPLRKPARNAML